MQYDSKKSVIEETPEMGVLTVPTNPPTIENDAASTNPDNMPDSEEDEDLDLVDWIGDDPISGWEAFMLTVDWVKKLFETGMSRKEILRLMEEARERAAYLEDEMWGKH